MTEVNVFGAMNTFFSSERVELILGALKLKQSAEGFINTVGQASNLDIQSKLNKPVTFHIYNCIKDFIM